MRTKAFWQLTTKVAFNWAAASRSTLIFILVSTFVIQHVLSAPQATTTTNSNSPHLQQQHRQPEVAAISSSPSHLKPPVIVSKPEETIVAPGSNVTLACEAQGSQPLTFVWFQDEKNLTKSNAPSTKLLEEKRYEIFEEVSSTTNTTTSYLFLMNLRLFDTSLFLCWVENSAGYTFENYSLIVSDSFVQNQAHTLTTNLYRTQQTSVIGTNYPPIQVIIAGLVILLFAAIIFTGLHRYQCKRDDDDDDHDHHHHESQLENKKGKTNNSNSKNEFDKSAMNEKSIGACVRSPTGDVNGKFSPVSTVGSAADDEEDEDDGSSQTSSCNKNNLRVLAVNDLDGFIEQMRSGIINMDYHSMSPVIQFNKTSNIDNQQQQQLLQQQHHINQQLAPLQLQGQNTTTTTTTTAQALRTQPSLLAEHHHHLQQPQAFQSQQQLYQPANMQPYQSQPANFITATTATTTMAAPSYLPTVSVQQQTYQQQLAAAYQQQQQHHQQQVAPAQQLVQQSQIQPQRHQSYQQQLAYMNQIPSSSSSHSSQSPFTTSYPSGNNSYYY